MTKRYFYTHLLAAAWMAKHFGMAFDVNDFDGVMFRNWDDWQEFFTGNFHHFQKGPAKWRIHPDSLHLLEPQVGDILLNPDNRAATAIPDGDKGKDYNCVRIGGAADFVKNGSATIIQRRNVAFMWPESEPA